jgi:hypothetical protein
MRRAILITVIIALLVGGGGSALGCGKGPSVDAIANAQASASPAAWAKLVRLDGSLNGASRGRSGVTVALTGSALRFDVTYGPAPGWGANHARLRYWLYPVSDSKIPQPAVPLRVVAKTHKAEQDSTTLRLETTGSLSPGTYELLYQGSGFYGMIVYQR